MDANFLLSTAGVCAEFLSGRLGGDWNAKVPGQERTVAEVVAHISDSLHAYAFDLAAGPTELSTWEGDVRPNSARMELVVTLGTTAKLLAAVVAASSPESRGWHPWGPADPSGFAAMGCDELLVHTYDAARGLGAEFTAPPRLAAATVYRLFPWVPTDTEPWPTLLWANGRAPLGDRPRLTKWTWHGAPLTEWDGSAPIG
ncbi:maleylpyruvate isomerase N-terminal domain-containing protein [Amycolatopsis sp.]|uniref:maleylpyruvate isomerase N-terminal domain-containing protein n=1 Tax=Amycolatopsis sp. TaxID=37632 RepID=UPI002C58BB33|nr:maleylpyruvate isomerase N-terminal domain-containing protein [Amycolatopsis sp.]HVV13780.1 maleylpyruvate isomerase N-terminal domain-containing protein [Amycolatopsis sp.]